MSTQQSIRASFRYSKALQDTVKQMLEENPSERPNIKTVCHICDLHKNMRSSAAKEEHESNSAAKLSSQERNISSHEESGYSSVSSHSMDKQKQVPNDATRIEQASYSSGPNNAQPNSNQASSSSHNGMVPYIHTRCR